MTEVKEAAKPKTEPARTQTSTTNAVARPSRPAPLRSGGFPAFLPRFAEEMDRLFDDFGLRMPGLALRGVEYPRRAGGSALSEWTPRVQMSVRDGKFTVRADLPGMSKDDVQVEIGDEAIVIGGERKEEKTERRDGFTYDECSYGSFYRALPLPEGVDASKATAEFRNGVLEVSMPVHAKAEPQTRRLEIQEKK
ncbi:MAG: Hsp20/alpha crystallin family protein [Planctomycetota bacterium]|nr:Hsp20/alpha crystallin family protein [Planctomycetota bacterium]